MSAAPPAFDAVIRRLQERTGLDFAPPRQVSAEQGIRFAMKRAGISDPNEYRDLIERDGRAFDDLVAELTVGETYFFREPGQFQFIRAAVLPDICRRRGSGAPVRAWSAGCASGEEAYSLAIVLVEAGLAERCHLLATDISKAALVRARKATYRPWSLRGEGAAAALPYLRPGGEGHVLDERIRRLVTFEYLNLALDMYPSFATGTWGMDLILCRNVLIYLNRATVQRVAGRLFEALTPGGWLLTASSDPPLGGVAPLETVVTAEGVFYRRPLEPAAQPEFVETDVPTSEEWQPPENTASPEAPCTPGTDAPRSPIAEAVSHILSLANRDPCAAETACADAVKRYPLATELHYLHALLFLERGNDAEAMHALRRVLYLDRSLALAHFTLGSVLRRRGDIVGARRGYRNARDLCRALPAEQVVPLSEGEHAGRLAEAAAAQLALLDAPAEAAP